MIISRIIISRYKFSVELLKKYEKEPLKNLLNFVTLCCGILHNGTKSINFLGVLLNNPSGNLATDF